MFPTLLHTTLIPLGAAVSAGLEAPSEEVDVFVAAVTAAVYLGAGGAAGDGYACPLAACRRVDGLSPDDAPWAAALAREYRAAMRRYAGRFGVAVE